MVGNVPAAAENCGGPLGFAGQFRLGRGGWPPFFTFAAGLTCGFSRRGLPRADDHVGQAEERVELMTVFGQPSIAHLPVSKNVFDDVEGMFDEGSHRGFGFL